MRADHPIDKFLFILRSDPAQELRADIIDAVYALAPSREWIVSPPSVVEEDDLLTVEHDVYSAQEPWNKYIPIELDRRHYEEVHDLVAALCELRAADFEIYLGGLYVGRICDGRPDRTLNNGLLEPWDQTTRGNTSDFGASAS